MGYIAYADDFLIASENGYEIAEIKGLLIGIEGTRNRSQMLLELDYENVDSTPIIRNSESQAQ